MKKEQRIQLIIGIIALAVLGIFFLPLKIPYAIDSVAKLLPARQWILSRGTDGEILINSVNHLTGINYSSRLTSFERGESLSLNFAPTLGSGHIIEKGDTLGVIYSSSQQENLVQLNGQLGVLTATLEANISGDKKTIVREAQERLAKAQSEYDKQSKVVERLKPLYEKDFISEAEYQTAFDELTVLSKEVKVRQAELESCLTGEKAEEINMLKQQIKALENEIAFIHQQIDTQNYIIAPFRSRIDRSFSPDTLLVLSTVDSAIAFIPIALEKAAYIKGGEKVAFKSNGIASSFSGTVQTKQWVMQLIRGKQCIVLSAAITEPPDDLITGLIAQSEINCGSISLQNYIKRNIIY